MPSSRPAASWLARAKGLRSFVATTAAYLFIMQISACFLLIPIALRGEADFRQLYTAGYMVRSGHAVDLYDHEVSGQFQNALVSPAEGTLPFNHLAYEALIFAPLSLLSFRSAYLLFLLANLAMLSICFNILRPHLLALAEIWRFLPAALFVCFYPVTVALIQGQDSILLLTLMTAAFTSVERGRPLRAGICVGLTLFKFQFTIPVFVLFLAWKWRRAAAGCVLASAAAGCLSLWVTGLAGFGTYVRSLVSMSAALKTTAQQQLYAIHPEAMPNFRGLFSTLAGQHTPHAVVQALILLCSGFLLFLAARRRPSFPLAIGVAVLVSYHGLIHDAALLVIPLGLLVVASRNGSSTLSGWTVAWAAVVLVAPTLLMLEGGPYFLMAVPVLGMVVAGARKSTPEAGSMPTETLESVTESDLLDPQNVNKGERFWPRPSAAAKPVYPSPRKPLLINNLQTGAATVEWRRTCIL